MLFMTPKKALPSLNPCRMILLKTLGYLFNILPNLFVVLFFNLMISFSWFGLLLDFESCDKTLFSIPLFNKEVQHFKRPKLSFIDDPEAVSYTHLRAHETRHDLVCRLLLEKKKKNK